MDINEETLELLERRLGERVEKRVRGRLFALYGFVGSAILGVVGYFGYDVVDSVKSNAELYARKAVEGSVAEAEAAAARADDLARRSSAKLEVLDEWQTQREAALSNNEQRVVAAQAQVNHIAQEIEARLGSIVEKLKETEAQIAAQRDRAQEQAGIGNVSEVARNVAELTLQVQALDDQIREIRTKAPAELSYDAKPADRAKIDEVYALSTEQTSLPSSRARNDTVVYFQFAGVKREVAKAISARLADAGYEMPGEERTENAAGKHEVRYFFDEDQARAARLVADLNRGLAEAGYKADVVAKDFTGYKAAKPRPGTIELWLEPVRLP